MCPERNIKDFDKNSLHKQLNVLHEKVDHFSGADDLKDHVSNK